MNAITFDGPPGCPDLPPPKYPLPRTESVVLKAFKDLKVVQPVPVNQKERHVEVKSPKISPTSPLIAEDTIASFYNIDP